MKQQKLLAAILCAATPLSYAATDTLDEIVVTATRLEQPLKQSLSSTTLITAQDIRNSQAPDVPTILRNVAGVELSQNGGLGKTAGLFLRGTDSTHVLVLLDGVRINSATTGMTAIDQLMLDQVERIEVVRGNVSSLYGSEAIGGVVQIFTKRGHGAPAANVSASMGSQGTQRLSAGFGGVADSTDFSVQLSTLKTDGVSALNPALVASANPDRDGYRNNSLSASVGHAFNADHRISATLFGSIGNNQYDNAFNQNQTDVNSNRAQIWKFSLASDDQITETWHSKLQLANGTDQYRDFLNGQPTVFFGQPSALFQTSNNQLTWQNTLRLSDSKQLLLGAESLQQQVSSDINPGFVQTTRHVDSLFAGYTGHYQAHQVQANLRHDGNSQYGSATTGLLGYGYAFSDAWRATASYSTAFRAPTFNELYFPNTGFGGGNPALEPEHSRNAEAGLRYFVAGGQQLDLVYFDNRTHNLISGWPPVNVNKARIDGVEFSYSGRFGDTGVKAALTSQDPRDATTGVQLDRRTKLHGSLGITQQLGTWQVGGEWLYSGTREDNFTDPNTFVTTRKTLASYNLLNLTAGYAVSKELRLSLRADNLTNQNDSNAFGYNPLGRIFFVGLNYQQ